MALAAVDRFVRPRQFKTGQRVVEFIFIKTDDIEIASVVVAVANGAIFSFDVF